MPLGFFLSCIEFSTSCHYAYVAEINRSLLTRALALSAMEERRPIYNSTYYYDTLVVLVCMMPGFEPSTSRQLGIIGATMCWSVC